MNTLEEAIKNVELTNDNLVPIAKQLASKYTQSVDEIINYVIDHVNELSNDKLRCLVTELSFNAYSLGEAKEYSLLKSEIAESLSKETLATEFNLSQGTVEARRNQATLNASNDKLTELLYATVASLLKTKLDEIHRIVDTLKTVITSRNTELKINQGITEVRVGD